MSKFKIQICKDMKINPDSRAIVRAHRTGTKWQKSQPIMVKVAHFKGKLKVLRAKRKFTDVATLVVEDFPQELLNHRKQFTPILRPARTCGGKYWW